MSAALAYAVVTPARNEADNLRRLATSLASQLVVPVTWLIVDNGSSDDTADLAAELASEQPWIRSVAAPTETGLARGGPVVRAFHVGLAAMADKPALIAKVDADVSMDPDYFARLQDAFAVDASLGIASGSCYEVADGVWRKRFGTGANVWGAARVYRWACLEQILPLDERMGWDGIDVVKANVRGWRTATLLDLPFRHHRVEAVRDSSSWRAWAVQGSASHYMGYRPSYMVVRTAHHMRGDPAALSMLWHYVVAGIRRAPTCPDPTVRDYLRREQRLRNLPARRREALGEL